MTPPVFLCLPTLGLGGAEKRFAGLWRHLRGRGWDRLTLVVSSSAHELLAGLPELQPFPAEGVASFAATPQTWRRSLRDHLAGLHRREPRAVLHYVMVGPWEVQAFASPRTLHSQPAASLRLFNWKGRAMAWLAALSSSRVDVLDQGVYRQLTRGLPFKRGAFSLTPGSFVDLQHYRPLFPKRDRLVFSGNFSAGKGIFRLLEALPETVRRLRAEGFAEAEFCLLGRPEPRVDEWCRRHGAELNVRTWFEPEPRRVLADARVCFSLQQENNYPSKALLEGLACGCLPIVTAVGTSEEIAPRDLAFYVPREFTPGQLAQACLEALRVAPAQVEERAAATRAFLQERFSLDAMADYYAFLYRQLAAL